MRWTVSHSGATGIGALPTCDIHPAAEQLDPTAQVPADSAALDVHEFWG